jgi:hypothetical protein
MKISDEALMAYADGEGDASARASVESAMREDPEITRRVAHHQAMREAMSGAFSAVIHEPVPQRLIAAARGANRKPTGRTLRRWQPLAMAASLLLGIGVGYLTWHRSGTLVEANSGGLVAGASLANALSTQLAEDRGSGLVAVTGLSFRDKSGGYCRTFSLRAAASGLACRDGSLWKIKALAQSTGENSANGANNSNFRPAGSAMPAAVRAAVEESIDGEPLDRAGEIAARQAGWAGGLAEKRSK